MGVRIAFANVLMLAVFFGGLFVAHWTHQKRIRETQVAATALTENALDGIFSDVGSLFNTFLLAGSYLGQALPPSGSFYPITSTAFANVIRPLIAYDAIIFEYGFVLGNGQEASRFTEDLTGAIDPATRTVRVNIAGAATLRNLSQADFVATDTRNPANPFSASGAFYLSEVYLYRTPLSTTTVGPPEKDFGPVQIIAGHLDPFGARASGVFWVAFRLKDIYEQRIVAQGTLSYYDQRGCCMSGCVDAMFFSLYDNYVCPQTPQAESVKWMMLPENLSLPRRQTMVDGKFITVRRVDVPTAPYVQWFIIDTRNLPQLF